MAIERRSTKGKKLAERIRILILDGAYADEGKVPPVREMARTYGASVETILKALSLLCSWDVLMRVPGKRGYYVPATRAQDQAQRTPPDRKQRAALALEDWVARNAYRGDGKLPSVKTLCRECGYGERTLRKALELLTDRGVIRRRNRAYHPAIPTRAPGGRANVYLIAQPRAHESFPQSYAEFRRAVERALQSIGWGELLVGDEQIEVSRDQVAGFIYLTAAGTSAENRFAQKFRGVPIVLLDPVHHPEAVRHPGNGISVLSFDNRMAGREVGMYLRRCGHHSVAVFNHVTGTKSAGWLSHRLSGLMDAFPGDRPMSKGASAVLFTRPVRPPRNPEIIAAATALKKALHDERVLGGRAMEHAAHMVDRIAATSSRVYRKMEPQFTAALKNPRFTAWICINDDCALAAQAFLERNKVRVPDDIALVSFDNTDMAYIAGITSHDPGYDTLGSMAVHAIVHPPGKRGLTRKTISGRLVVRNSSRILR